MSSSGTPAGWYPDPEHPGQTRYWNGTAWAASSAPPGATPPVPAAGGSGGGKAALIIVAVIAALALLGGGVFALTRGGDGGGVEELDEDEFIETVSDLCQDFDEDGSDLTEEVFADLDSDEIEELSDVDPDVLDEWADGVADLTDEFYDDISAIAPEGEADDWLEAIVEWKDVTDDLISALRDGDDGEIEDLSAEVEDLGDDLEDEFGIECDGDSMTSTDESASAAEPDVDMSDFGDPSDNSFTRDDAVDELMRGGLTRSQAECTADGLEDAGISFQEANDAATGSALFDEVVEIATDCVLES